MPKQDRRAYFEEIEALIVRCLDELFNQGLSRQESFDAWHKATCEKICEVSETYNLHKWAKRIESGFTFGIAQMLINLTIKNILVMEKWDNDLEPIKPLLHVPVDSKIMQAASDDLEIPVPQKNGGVGKYSNTGAESDSKSWIKWDYSDYTNFQEELRKATSCPIDWEYTVSIREREQKLKSYEL